MITYLHIKSVFIVTILFLTLFACDIASHNDPKDTVVVNPDDDFADENTDLFVLYSGCGAT